MNDFATTDATPRWWRIAFENDGTAWLFFDKPNASANTLSRIALAQLNTCLDEVERRLPRALIIVSEKDSGFIAGADIKEFTAVKSTEQAMELVRAGQAVFARLEALSIPTVAAINGFALGGGLELALACRYRIAASGAETRLGFPEVQLGIHPAWGGTVRSVRLIGPAAALEMMVSGRALRGEEALKRGLIDKLVSPAELRTAARSLALNPPAAHDSGLRAKILNFAPLRFFLAGLVRKQVRKRARPDHYPAPYSIIELWRKYGADRTVGYQAEARSLAKLLETPTCRNLVRVFLLQDRLKNLGARTSVKVERVHVVGAGLMGGDIATLCAARQLDVTLQDTSQELVQGALDRAAKYFAKRYRDDLERSSRSSRLRGDVAGEGIANADVVIEAIYEDADAKRKLYAVVEPKLKSGALLGTNTSSIVLEELAAQLARPDRLVGVHFFNPVAQMPLVEIVHGEQTSKESADCAMALVRQLDKLPLPCRSSPGFVVNRVLMPYLTEAMIAADEGIPLAIIDRAATDFGMPMGPIELADVIGLDIALHVGQILGQVSGRPEVASIRQLVAQKKLGKKSGEGFYVWHDGKPVKPGADQAALPPDLQDRLILPILNESVAVLREHVVEDADLIDAGIIFGTGFAPFRGGPIQYARSRGVAQVVARLEELSHTYGAHLRPDAGWQLLQ